MKNAYFSIIASPVSVKPTIEQDNKNIEEPKPYCSQFDLTKRISKEALEEAKMDILQWDYQGDEDYKTLIDQVRKVVLEGNFSSAVPVAPGTPRNALRLAIHSIASPSWQSQSPHVSYTNRQVETYFFLGFIQVFPCTSWITSIFIRYSHDYYTCSLV